MTNMLAAKCFPRDRNPEDFVDGNVGAIPPMTEKNLIFT